MSRVYIVAVPQQPGHPGWGGEAFSTRHSAEDRKAEIEADYRELFPDLRVTLTTYEVRP